MRKKESYWGINVILRERERGRERERDKEREKERGRCYFDSNFMTLFTTSYTNDFWKLYDTK